jgi:hypothetical protein
MVRLKFAVLVEKDDEGYYVVSVPELPGCHTQAKTLDELTLACNKTHNTYEILDSESKLRTLSIVTLIS